MPDTSGEAATPDAATSSPSSKPLSSLPGEILDQIFDSLFASFTGTAASRNQTRLMLTCKTIQARLMPGQSYHASLSNRVQVEQFLTSKSTRVKSLTLSELPIPPQLDKIVSDKDYVAKKLDRVHLTAKACHELNRWVQLLQPRSDNSGVMRPLYGMFESVDQLEVEFSYQNRHLEQPGEWGPYSYDDRMEHSTAMVKSLLRKWNVKQHSVFGSPLRQTSYNSEGTDERTLYVQCGFQSPDECLVPFQFDKFSLDPQEAGDVQTAKAFRKTNKLPKCPSLVVLLNPTKTGDFNNSLEYHLSLAFPRGSYNREIRVANSDDCTLPFGTMLCPRMIQSQSTDLQTG